MNETIKKIEEAAQEINQEIMTLKKVKHRNSSQKMTLIGLLHCQVDCEELLNHLRGTVGLQKILNQ